MDKLVGKPLPRVEDIRLVSGKGRYTDDVNLPGQAYGAFVRSPHPHARIRSINIEAALREYASGARTHPTMDAIAKSLSDQDIADLAAYYANLK